MACNNFIASRCRKRRAIEIQVAEKNKAQKKKRRKNHQVNSCTEKDNSNVELRRYPQKCRNKCENFKEIFQWKSMKMRHEKIDSYCFNAEVAGGEIAADEAEGSGICDCGKSEGINGIA